MRQLLEAGVHFGHQSKRWNPKMRPYIYTSKNNIHVIDLNKTIPLIEKTYEFVRKLAEDKGTVLFVGTKNQAQDTIADEAKRCGMYYVNQRWLGGTLTNFKTLKKNIARLKEIEKLESDGMFDKLPRKEVSNLKREHKKLVRGLGGIRDMATPPAAVFIVDAKKEQIAIKESRKLNIPVIGLVDTNCDPEELDFPIPANDDAIRSIRLLTSLMANAVLEGRQLLNPEEAAAALEAATSAPLTAEETADEAKSLEEEERLAELAKTELARLKALGAIKGEEEEEAA